ncbi:MAG: DNA-3-methyladenine glycosylase [Acaryochloridaceae cyanobacterium RL_2_7]|nr:DNA-3-methyladenine glycosylase [Acaryochloridaceae cyanobacterium RL_2_7]
MAIQEPDWIRPEWLNRSVVEVAPELVGCYLVRQLPQGEIRRAMIVETEAYEAGDPACHAYQRQTQRNAPMFGPSGIAYVYLIYGLYHCFNIVTDRDGLASAVLIRALTPPPLPTEFAATLKGRPIKFAAGPGKLCRVMEIDRTLSGMPLQPDSGLWLEPRSPDFQQNLAEGKETLKQTTRIGISKGIEYPWRWYLQNSPSVSIPT